jgi:hypothetical protein
MAMAMQMNKWWRFHSRVPSQTFRRRI